MPEENVSASSVSSSSRPSNSTLPSPSRQPGRTVGELTPYERDVLPFIRPFTDVLVSLVPRIGVDRHLDHGAGTGEVILQLERTHKISQTVAVDPSPVMVGRLNEIFGQNNKTVSSVETFQGTLGSFMSERTFEPFDLVTSQLVLPFVPDPGGEL